MSQLEERQKSNIRRRSTIIITIDTGKKIAKLYSKRWRFWWTLKVVENIGKPNCIQYVWATQK